MKTHFLKTWPSYIQDVIDGLKTFEVRRADKDFRVGDFIWMLSYDPVDGFLNPQIRCQSESAPPCKENEYSTFYGGILLKITYILGPSHCPPGFVVMGIQRVKT